MITSERLAEIEARAKDATPGLWKGEGDYIMVYDKNGEFLNSINGVEEGEIDFNNITFIAAAHQDIPNLIEEVRRLQRIIEINELILNKTYDL